MAFLTDTVLLAILVFVVKIPIWIVQASAGDSFLFKPFLFEFTAVDVFCYLLTLAYYVLMTYYSGATVGKHLMKLKVVDSEGQKLTFMSVLIRESVGKYLSAFIANIGYIMAAFDSRKQGLHDKIADTCVVYKIGLNQNKIQQPVQPVVPVQQMPVEQQSQQVQLVQLVQPTPAAQQSVQPSQPMPYVQQPVQPQQSNSLIQPGPNGRFSLPEDKSLQEILNQKLLFFSKTM